MPEFEVRELVRYGALIRPGTPVTVDAPVGTSLYRAHASRFGATAFNPTRADDPLRGGRFDSDDGSYAYLYAGQDISTALAEVLIRDLPSGLSPPRILLRARLRGLLLSELRVEQALQLVSLRGADLGHVGQDAWLTKCSAEHYSETRRWSRAIRGWAPTTQGLVWRSFRDEDRFSYVLFADRIAAGTLRERSSMAADAGAGLLLVEQVLQRQNVVLG
ncbi:MAG: RES family NAD+ phosphorylase [Myxococcales bacterium]|nr:RES family NAD+ phosphorylase [Myxococcales bacterium]